MDSKQSSDKQFALLIDADNVSAKYIKPILNELSKYGTVTYKRIYGDWTQALHAKWKDALLENSITPIQQFSYTYGKNATDSAMIIDAMDILYSNDVNGFCIVSSDSDFTRLASRLRESGLTVIGMGEKKTPTPFRKACDIFTTLELLVQNRGRGRNENGSLESTTSKEEVEQAVVDIITDNQNNGKATGLGEVGSRLQKRYPDFDVRSYGTNLLSKLLEEFDRVTIIKTGSSVAVELTEPHAHDAAVKQDQQAVQGHEDEKSSGNSPSKSAQEATPHRARRGRTARKITGKMGATTPASTSEEPSKVEVAAPETTPQQTIDGEKEEKKSNTPKSSRSRNRKKAEVISESPAAQTSTAPSDDASANKEGTDQKSEESPVSTAAAATKPRGRRGRKPKSQSEEPAKKTDIKTTSDEPATPPARRRGRPRVIGANIKATTPEGYIKERVEETGKKGMQLAQLTKELRNRFPGFKVKDLGVTQLRFYFANNKDYVITKNGHDYDVAKA